MKRQKVRKVHINSDDEVLVHHADTKVKKGTDVRCLYMEQLMMLFNSASHIILAADTDAANEVVIFD